MNRTPKFFALIVLVLLSYPIRSHAQKYDFKIYDNRNGLVQNWVRTLSQDSLGRLWIGTTDGISIFDGNSFTNFTSVNGLRNSTINDFFPLDNRTMAVATNGAGLTVFSFIPYRGDSLVEYLSGKTFFIQDSVNTIFKDKNAGYWFCTDKGVSQWRKVKSGNWKISQFDAHNGLVGKYISTVAQTVDSTLWFGTATGLISLKNHIFHHFKSKSILSNRAITKLFTDSNNQLWIGTTSGLYTYTNNRIKPFLMDGRSVSATINDILESYDGRIWIGTSKGLIRYDGHQSLHYNKKSGLCDNYVTSLLQDREGNIWIGTHNGLNELPNLKYSFSRIDTHFEHLIKLTTDPKGRVWVSSDDGLYLLKKDHLEPFKLNGTIPDSNILEITFNKTGKAHYLGTYRGLFEMTDTNIRRISTKDGLIDNTVSDVVQSDDGICWIGTSSGLTALKNGRLYNFSESISQSEPLPFKKIRSSNIPGKTVRDLLIDKDKNLWMATWAHGLFEVTHDSVISFGPAHGLTDPNIRYLYRDHEGVLWIATRYKGVFRYQNGTIQQFNVHDGLASNWVSTVVEDTDGNHWFGTAKGLSMFDGKTWKTFNASEGIIGGEILSSTIDGNGKLWFGSNTEITSFEVKKTRYPDVAPQVFIKNIRFINGSFPTQTKRNIILPVPFNLSKEIPANQSSGEKIFDFNYNQRSLTFEFAGIGFGNTNKVKYQYKLEGLEANWSAITSRNYVSYIKIPPGEYTFKVRARNQDGKWSAVPASASFIISTPLWQKSWFLILVAVFLISAISFIIIMTYRIRFNQMMRIRDMRDTIASDLHDDVGSSLSSISIFSELARRQIHKSPTHAANLIQRIEKISRNLIDSMDDIVWSINADNDTFEDAILRMQEFAVSLLEAKSIRTEIKLPKNPDQIILPLETRRNLLLIFKEMINNIAKHSKADSVLIRFDLNNDIIIKIEDNGTGFFPSKVTRGNGLGNLKKRASVIHGNIQIESVPKRGTSITLTVPVSTIK